jgi:hypothetical protein
MPFQSQAQRAYMHKNLPEIAAKWEKEYDSEKPLPKRIHPKKNKPSILSQRRRRRRVLKNKNRN